MSVFSLNWFKSERDKELELLKIKEQRLRNTLLQKMLDTPNLFDRSVAIPTTAIAEKSSTIDEGRPTEYHTWDKEVFEAIHGKHEADVEWVKEVTEEGHEIETPILSGMTIVAESIPKDAITVSHDELRKEMVQQSIYKTAKLINNVINVILRDGTILTRIGVDRAFFELVKTAETEQAIRDLFVLGDAVKQNQVDNAKKEERKKEIESVNVILKGMSLLATLSDFEVKNDSVYLLGIDRSMPRLLVEKFISLFDKYEGLDVTRTDEYLSLKKFWLKCCLNPNAQSAEDLYTFLSHHQFRIDKHGNFYAYRRVVSKNDNIDKNLVDFISNTYNKVKAVWKKNPAQFEVFNDNGYALVDSLKQNHGYNNHVGNLKDLYINLPTSKSNNYTDAQTGSFNYRVGEVISMPRHHGDDNNQVSCSKGFHQASKEYDYSEFGDTPILSIINPMDVLAVPLNEVGKLRVCRWFFAMTLSENEQFILDDEDFDVSDLGDIFEEKCMEGLTDYVQNSFAEEVQRHTFTIPKLSDRELYNIVTSLEEMESTLSKRISIIK